MRYWLRNGLYLSALVLALPWLMYRRFKTGRYRHGLAQKLCGLPADYFCQPEDNLPKKPTIWLHGVSVGEVQLLIPLLRHLQSRHPRARIVLSTTTDSGMALARDKLPDVCTFYFPLDFSWAVRRTLNAVRPALIVFGELELWPNLIDYAHEQQVPMMVVNGRLSDRSHRRYVRLSRMTRVMFGKLDHVAAQSDAIAERFVDCGCPADRVTATGSIKFDNVNQDRDATDVVRLRELVGIRPEHRVVLVGSTQAPEEETALAAYMKLKRGCPDLKLIVVPRHPDRFQSVYDLLKVSGERVARRSQIQAPVRSDQWDVLLVDSVGELKWWWGLAEIAIVGGSFGQRGGQNMLEPAGYGCNVAFGPNTENFKEIANTLVAAQAAIRLPTLSHVAPWLGQQLSAPQPGRQRGLRARQIVQQGQGATARTLDLIEAQLAIPAANRQAA